MTAEVCQFLPWDTEFFGKRIARVNANVLDPLRLQQIMAWCAAEQIDCLYFLADSHDLVTTRLAEQQDFRLVDIRLTLLAKIDVNANTQTAPASQITMRPSQASDLPALQAIARTAYTNSRYYADGCFSADLCNQFYETWITKSCQGYEDVVLVAQLAGEVLGYISCKLVPGNALQGQIGLVGVADHAQGRGVGQTLLKAALAWFAEQAVQEVLVVTQGRNIAAQRIYQRAGFLTSNVQLWYHKWFRGC